MCVCVCGRNSVDARVFLKRKKQNDDDDDDVCASQHAHLSANNILPITADSFPPPRTARRLRRIKVENIKYFPFPPFSCRAHRVRRNFHVAHNDRKSIIPRRGGEETIPKTIAKRVEMYSKYVYKCSAIQYERRVYAGTEQ